MCNFVTVKMILDENFQDYKKASMFIAFPRCDFKCFRELGLDIKKCQNYKTLEMENFTIQFSEIFDRYIKNKITSAIVLGGLEPFLSFDEVYGLIKYFRSKKCLDEFVIYTGYYPDEISDEIEKLKKIENIIVKFGRFIPNSKSKFDKILGVHLCSENQYALYIN